ncbi:hypothetical protein P3S67_030815 [Capsicum chacoense]
MGGKCLDSRDKCLKFYKGCREYTVGGFTLLFVPCNQTCMVRVVRLLFLLRCLKSGEPANGEAQLICLIGKESLQPMELQEAYMEDE